MSLLAVSGLVKRFGGLLASDDIHLVVEPGELHAVIGPNGAGKTTLINQLSGELMPDAGSIEFEGRSMTALPTHVRALAGISRSYQITSVFPEFSAQQNVMLAAQAHAGHSFRFWQRVSDEPVLIETARTALQQVGLLHRAPVPVAALAHGERRQLEIAMTLATQPRLLLLDEPMAGMSQHEAEAMIELLHGLKGRYGVVLVEHDMDAVFVLADRITVLVYGRVIACGVPVAIRANADVREAYLGDEIAAD
ncbi:MAG: ABC transporter ATP-binding protein [Betaproteobacteria bacterium]